MLHPSQDWEKTNFLEGALMLIDKPKGWTSFDVVNKVRFGLRKLYQVKNIKVGHSGTLDPMATGLLLLCTGKWTKELHSLQGLDKEYDATITLGTVTDSYDAEGNVIRTSPVPPISTTEIESLLSTFTGEIDQLPPAFSAIKQNGKKLYELARAGKEVKTEPRKVVVYSIRLIRFEGDQLEIKIHCGSGFYVRSLAYDLGEKIGCGAHLSGLIRTRIGTYSLTDAHSMDAVTHQLRIEDKAGN